MSRRGWSLAAVVLVAAAAGVIWLGRSAPQPVAAPPAPPTSANAATAASTPSCDETTLAAWQMLGAPDTVARRALLFANGHGSHRVGAGDALGGGVVVQSVGAAQVTLACLESTAKRTLDVPAAAREVTRMAAPMGN